jgi:hypothetical protein
MDAKCKSMCKEGNVTNVHKSAYEPKTLKFVKVSL